MNAAKLHHYVPQFYLKQFSNGGSQLWVWDKQRDRIFSSNPKNLAGEKHFYLLDDKYWRGEFDPQEMELQLSNAESAAAEILSSLIAVARQKERGDKFAFSKADKEILSFYIAMQFLRTADTREILWLLNFKSDPADLNPQEPRAFHIRMLWDHRILNPFLKYLRLGTWVVAKNTTDRPFVTSDNPVCFRTATNAMWLKIGMLGRGSYVVFPISSEAILYVYPDHQKWAKLKSFDSSLSPIFLTEEMVDDENTGQAFMSSRFLFSESSDFRHVRAFQRNIGTETFRR